MKILTDMPQITEPTDFGYAKKSVRVDTLKKLRSESYDKIATVDVGGGETRDLYQTGSKKSGYLWCFDTNPSGEEEVTYLVKYIPTTLHGGKGVRVPPTLTQVAVWNNRAYNPILGTRSLPSVVFQDILLPRFGAMSSDSQQTQKGKEFWEQQIQSALKSPSLYVYLSKPHGLVRVATQIELRQLYDEAWGPEAEKFKIRWIISNNPIHGVSTN
jgi:hypothetical protein